MNGHCPLLLPCFQKKRISVNIFLSSIHSCKWSLFHSEFWMHGFWNRQNKKSLFLVLFSLVAICFAKMKIIGIQNTQSHWCGRKRVRFETCKMNNAPFTVHVQIIFRSRKWMDTDSPLFCLFPLKDNTKGKLLLFIGNATTAVLLAQWRASAKRNYLSSICYT